MGESSKNIVLSLSLMLVLIFSGYLIGTFFSIGLEYYMPFLVWLLALCIFNIFLDKNHVNVYLKEVKS
jgi:uncharacterized membrane protein